MNFTWDDEKERRNLEKHKMDFSLAEAIISCDDVIIKLDDRRDYGEDRYLAYSEVDGAMLCLCFMIRDGSYRVISLRRANKKEWRKACQ